MASEEQFELCVDKLYGALTDPSGLPDAIRSLRLMFEASGATHIYFNRRGEIAGFADDGHDPGCQRLYLDHYAAIDPTRALLKLRPGEWLQDDRLLDSRHTPDPEFVNDFAPQAAMRWFRGCKVYEGDAGVACFSLQRGSDAPPFDDATLVLLERIRPHLSRFFRMALQMEAAIPALASAGAAMDMLRMAVCVVDAQCQIRYANPAAEELLGQGTMLKVKGGRLFSPDPQTSEMLRHAVAQASRPPRQASVFSPQPLASAVSRLQVRAVPLAPHLPLAHYGHGNLVLLFLATGAAPPNRHELQKLFGLTRAEADIVEMLVQGASADVCARRRGVSLTTVRTHVASILAKTGAGSQAQLMSLVLALPAVR